MLYRKHEDTINSWIKKGKDALLLAGARQVGKTHLIRHCLELSNLPFEELNFIEQPELKELFDTAKTTNDILNRLSLVAKGNLIRGKSIIFLDEVQELKEMVSKIKFLVEEGSFRYIMSGSLLGIELNDLQSVPVGYMRILDMYPMDLEEFAYAIGVNEKIIDILHTNFKKSEPVDEFIHEKFMDIFYLYLIVGGMPEAVSAYVKTNDLKNVSIIHEKIIRAYKIDFTKYEINNKLKLREIYNSMASELNQKNKRFF